MKPHLRSNGSKEGNKLLLDMLESGGASGMLEAMQTQLSESRQKAAQIQQEAEAAAKNTTLKANADAAAIRAQAQRDAADIATEANLKLRNVHRAKTEVADAQSALDYRIRLFDDKTKKFQTAIAEVFERHCEN